MAKAIEEAIRLRPTGQLFPRVGLGTWQLTGENAEHIVYNAIKGGYRHIDDASVYANEKNVGKGIKRALDEKLIQRKDLFVTTKLWVTYHKKEHVEKACRKQLEDLGLDYVDLYLIHWPMPVRYIPFEKAYPPGWGEDIEPLAWSRVPLHETWEAMESLVSKGLVKNIGVSNFDLQLLQDLLTYCKIPPSVNQVECHPHLIQKNLLRFCEIHNIVLACYSPLGRGPTKLDNDVPLLDQPVIADIAKKHGKTKAQVVLRWALQRSPNTVVLPKTGTEARLVENKDLYSFTLSPEDMTGITGLDKGRRIIDPANFLQNTALEHPVFS